MPETSKNTRCLAALDKAHVWHPFTPMKQWRESSPLVIERAQGPYLFDTQGNRYIDGVSSLWCNVHGHRVPEIDRAIRDQLDKVAHTTLLGLASPPSIELAARLCAIAPGHLNKVFYSDAGATAVEVAFKMAVGYWHHRGRPGKCGFIGLAGAYHGDTTGAMSVGYSDLFHRPFVSMVFPTTFFPSPDACRPPGEVAKKFHDSREALSAECEACWPSEDEALCRRLKDHCLCELETMLSAQADQTAAIVIEPVMQGAAGMICQPPGFVRGVAELAKRFDVLWIADEVATGFGRTARMFACEHDQVAPDILCLGKGISGGYLPLAATLTTDEIEQAFCGEIEDRRTLYHGHTYTGNALSCAAALASLDLFEKNRLLDHIAVSERMIRDRLAVLRACPHVLDIRQRGIMVGIELCRDRRTAEPFDFTKRTAAAVCHAMRRHDVLVRPLGDVIVLMPIAAMPHEVLDRMLAVIVETLSQWRFEP